MVAHTKSGAFRRRQSYFNTTHSSGLALVEFEKTARSQEDRVFALFMRHPTQTYTAEHVGHMAMAGSPRHCISRAMSNLTGEGFLVKTKKQSTGAYGRPIYHWKLHKGEPEQLRLV
jgi:hypothetical protein